MGIVQCEPQLLNKRSQISCAKGQPVYRRIFRLSKFVNFPKCYYNRNHFLPISSVHSIFFPFRILRPIFYVLFRRPTVTFSGASPLDISLWRTGVWELLLINERYTFQIISSLSNYLGTDLRCLGLF